MAPPWKDATGVSNVWPDYRAPGQRAPSEYRLTAKGLDLFPVLIALLQWGDRHCADGPPALLVTDRETGTPVEAVVRPGPTVSC